MTLKGKAITTVSLAIVALCIGALAIAYIIFHDNYTRLEQSEGKRQLAIASRIMQFGTHDLQQACEDVGNWLSLQNYLADENQQIVKDGLNSESLQSRRIDYLSVLDINRQEKLSYMADADNDGASALLKNLHTAQNAMLSWIEAGQREEGTCGYVEYGRYPMAVVCEGVYDSNKAKRIGWVVMGRIHKAPPDDPIGEMANLKLEFRPRPLISSSTGQLTSAALRHMDSTGNDQVVLSSGDKLGAYKLIADYTGRKSFLISTNAPRSAYQQGIKTVKASLIAVLVCGAVLAGTIIYAMSRYVVGPVATLNDAMQEIIRTGEPSSKIHIESNDEIGQLAQSFLLMLDAIRSAESKLHDAIAKAQQANQLKSKFLSMISHEIRTPLNGIIGLNEAIMAESDPAAIHQSAMKIETESEHLLELINTLLDNARIEAGKMDIESLPLSLDALSQDLINHCNGRAVKKKLQFKVNPDPALPKTVLGDELRLKQVLLNLVTNAIKFTEKGSVTVNITPVATSDSEATIRFEVVDTGIGMSAEQQDRIFESFSQADGNTTRRFGGTGLGTTISKNLVELMGGSIDVDSELGVGSRFWFDLPMEVCDQELLDDMDIFAEEPTQVDTAQEVAALPPCTADILVVEDYPINQEVVRMHLEHAGHRVSIACDGVEAVEAASKTEYDLILMDLQMPNMDGIEATRKIRQLDEHNATMPIIALSANTDVDSFVTCMEAGMNDYLTKPIRRDNLIEVLSRWLSANEAGALDAPQAPEENLAEQAIETTGDPVDIKRAVEEFCGSMDLVMQTLGQFADMLPGQLQEIRDALDSSDLDAAGAQAHKIKGGAANLTADPLAAAAEKMEKAAKSGDMDATVEHMDELTHQVDVLIDFTKADF